MGSYFRDYYSPIATQRATVGDTKFSVINQDHMGWLKCDGRGLSTASYNILFQVIRYSFGGSGNTFNLPDGRGKVPGAVGITTVNTLNPTTYVLGDVSGNQLHTLNIAEMPSHNHGTNASDTVVGNNLTGLAGGHTHSITDPGHVHSLPQSLTALIGTGPNDDWTQGSGTNTGSSTTGITIDSVADHQHSIATQGGDDPHNNMQPTIFMGNMFVYSGKYGAGLFPYAANTNIY
jgi:microcystin-dependent protein